METVKEFVIEAPFMTSDLYFSAFLKAKGMKLIDQIRDGGKKFILFLKTVKIGRYLSKSILIMVL